MHEYYNRFFGILIQTWYACGFLLKKSVIYNNNV